ncbi:hypothetical protein RKD23_004183 [Streptomyces sp. SAI-170]
MPVGIESDQVVYEYLSRVGDVAHQRQLPSAERMRLVSALRDEIDRRRAKAAVDSPAAVRRIIERIGTPDEVVTAAGGRGRVTAEQAPGPAAVPVQRDGADTPRPGVPRPRSEGAAPPHLATADELGDSVTQPDWWRVESSGPYGPGDEIPGFVGGVTIPELLKRPPRKEEAPEEDEEEAEEAEEASGRRRRLKLPAVRRWNNPVLLCAVALLAAGAVVGRPEPMALGWLIVWASRRLTKAEIKGTVLVVPGLVVAAGLVWLWGRGAGRWGEPIAQGHTADALTDTYPWVLRGAAFASALFLFWRSQRQK